MNYAQWKKNTCTILKSLCQWDMVNGTIVALTPIDTDHLTAIETSAKEAFEGRQVSAYMEITFRMADSAKSVLDNEEDPKATWDHLEKRFGAKQEGVQAMLMAKLQLAKWDGTGIIHAHLDYMVTTRAQLSDAGMKITDQSFYENFTQSLPTSLDLFIALYDNSTYDVNQLCSKFAKYEMRRKLEEAKNGKPAATSDRSLVLSSQRASSSKGRGRVRQDLTNVTCYRCGKKGHVQRRCPDGEKKEE